MIKYVLTINNIYSIIRGDIMEISEQQRERYGKSASIVGILANIVLALLKIIVGLIYSIIGLSLFFTGVNAGFIPTGEYIGKALAVSNKWLIIPIGMLVGLFITFAEPAVHVLANQVEDVTEGVISSKSMLFTLALAMALAVGLAMLRVITKINLLWIIIPGYAIALAMTFIVQEIFTGIAFDSGGVASGPMTATFLLPFAMGACEAVGGSAGDAFGVIALVAMTPLITIQILGLIYKLRSKQSDVMEQENEDVAQTAIETRDPTDDDIIDL